MAKPNESAQLAHEADADFEPGMDDILRSIRGILGEEADRKVEFPDTSANDIGEDLPPRREPPLAFLQRKRPPETVEPIVEAQPAAIEQPAAVPSLEDRLARHRAKAEAERMALRKLAEKASGAAAEKPSEPELRPEPGPAAETVEAKAEPVADVRAAPAAELDIFAAPNELAAPPPRPAAPRRARRLDLPEIEAEAVDYSRPAPLVEVLSPTGSKPEPALDETFEDIARSMLREKSDEMDGMLADMMRPMVREWLDDNLSGIVERVVREEIERVSRGTR